MRKKLILIDGSSILTTCFFASCPKEIMYAKSNEEKQLYYDKLMHTSSGVYTNGLYGMIKTLQKLLKNQNPDYMAIAFDKSRDTFRRNIYSKYKSNRKQTIEPLKEQFILAENFFENIGICTLYGDKYEADDYIASVATQFKEKNLDIFILTKDKDYLQLPSENIKCWMIQHNEKKADELYEKYHKIKQPVINKVFEFGVEEVKGETGVYPCQIAELKAMIGDPSDGYPGIRGINSVAVPLLNKYRTIENIYNAIDSCRDEKEQKELFDIWKKELGIKRNPIPYFLAEDDSIPVGREAAGTFKIIAEMKKDINLNISLNDMPGEWDQKSFKKYCQNLEMASLIEKAD